MGYGSADQMYMYFFTEKESSNVVTCQPFSINFFKTLVLFQTLGKTGYSA